MVSNKLKHQTYTVSSSSKIYPSSSKIYPSSPSKFYPSSSKIYPSYTLHSQYKKLLYNNKMNNTDYYSNIYKLSNFLDNMIILPPILIFSSLCKKLKNIFYQNFASTYQKFTSANSEANLLNIEEKDFQNIRKTFSHFFSILNNFKANLHILFKLNIFCIIKYKNFLEKVNYLKTQLPFLFKKQYSTDNLIIQSTKNINIHIWDLQKLVEDNPNIEITIRDNYYFNKKGINFNKTNLTTKVENKYNRPINKEDILNGIKTKNYIPGKYSIYNKEYKILAYLPEEELQLK